jgi:heme o synthase
MEQAGAGIPAAVERAGRITLWAREAIDSEQASATVCIFGSKLLSPSRLASFLELTKLRISAASTFTSAMGYLAFRHGLDRGLLATLAGTLLLAMAASAFNEVQEHDLDALMERTRQRPIPRGSVSPSGASLFASLLAVTGFTVLLWVHGWTPALLGLLALLWYNGFYTPLKRVSAFAVVPGSLIGALPPAIGWSAAGGSLAAPALLALALVLFIWQVPHFWLLALMHREGYERAGFPTLSGHFREPQILRLVFTWTCAAIAASAILPAFHAVTGLPALALLTFASLWLLTRSTDLLRESLPAARIRKAFMDINLFALMVMAAVILDALRGSADARLGPF